LPLSDTHSESFIPYPWLGGLHGSAGFECFQSEDEFAHPFEAVSPLCRSRLNGVKEPADLRSAPALGCACQERAKVNGRRRGLNGIRSPPEDQAGEYRLRQ